MKKYEGQEGFEILVKQNDTPDRWTLESYEISNGFVYSGITDGEELPDWYVQKGREIVLERIALAGRRLADILVLCYNKYQENQSRAPGNKL